MSKIDVFWAEQQDLNYLLRLIEEINRDEDTKQEKASNSQIISAMVPG